MILENISRLYTIIVVLVFNFYLNFICANRWNTGGHHQGAGGEISRQIHFLALPVNSSPLDEVNVGSEVRYNITHIYSNSVARGRGVHRRHSKLVQCRFGLLKSGKTNFQFKSFCTRRSEVIKKLKLIGSEAA